MGSKSSLLLGCCWALAGSLRGDVTVINAGLQPSMSVPAGVTLNSVMSSNNIGDQPTNLALSTTTGAASGLSLTASTGGFAIGGGGSFSPIGSNVYNNSSTIINGWLAGHQSAYGTIWQGGANALNGSQTMNLTLTGLTPSTGYSITLLSTRGNTYTAIENPGTVGFTYGGSTAGVTTAFQGTGALTDTTLSMTTSAGSPSGLNAREINWTFATEVTPQNAVITLAGAWNLNAVIISSTQADPFGITSFDADDRYVTPGSTVSLSWDVTGAETLSIDPFPGTVTGNTAEVTVNETTTFTLTATKGGQVTTATTRVGAGPPRPNILFFLVDDMGWQDTSVPFHFDAGGNPVRGVYNDRYRTPHMETLAAQGRRFTNAYAYAVCSPTRVSIMTGMNSARHHVTTWTHPITPTRDTGQNNVPGITSPAGWRKEGMDASDIALPHLLQQAGYRTIHSGKAHFGVNGYFAGDPTAIGFDVNIAGHGAGGPGSYLGTQNFGTGMWQVPGLESYHGQDIFLTEALTLEMNEEIERAVDDGVPFFAYMSHYAVHVPWINDNRFTANYPGLSGQELAFATVIEGMDKSLGDIIAKLQQLGVAEDTLVIFYSDNGSDLRNGIEESVLRGYKGTCWEGGVRVPLIVGWAKIDAANPFQTQLAVPQNSIENDIVCPEDMFPTVAAIASADYSHEIDGHDLTPYFRATPGHHRPQRFVHHFPHGHGTDHFAVLREGDWKLIYEYRATPVRRLFNLAADLGETNDLAASEPDRVMAMTRVLAGELHRYGAQFTEFTATGETIPPYIPDLPAVDLDNDGVPDVNEDPNRNGLQDPGETNPDNANSDGDNVDDGAEARLGLDPLDASSRFAAIPSQPSAGVLRLTWPSAPGATFTLRASPDLADWSELIEENIPAAPGTSTSRDLGMITGSPRFFRVSLDP